MVGSRERIRTAGLRVMSAVPCHLATLQHGTPFFAPNCGPARNRPEVLIEVCSRSSTGLPGFPSVPVVPTRSGTSVLSTSRLPRCRRSREPAAPVPPVHTKPLHPGSPSGKPVPLPLLGGGRDRRERRSAGQETNHVVGGCCCCHAFDGRRSLPSLHLFPSFASRFYFGPYLRPSRIFWQALFTVFTFSPNTAAILL